MRVSCGLAELVSASHTIIGEERGNKTLIQKYYTKIKSIRMPVWDCNLVYLVMNLLIFLRLEMCFEDLFRIFSFLILIAIFSSKERLYSFDVSRSAGHFFLSVI